MNDYTKLDLSYKLAKFFEPTPKWPVNPEFNCTSLGGCWSGLVDRQHREVVDYVAQDFTNDPVLLKLMLEWVEDNATVEIHHLDKYLHARVKRNAVYQVTIDLCANSSRVQFEGESGDMQTAVALAVKKAAGL